MDGEPVHSAARNQTFCDGHHGSREPRLMCPLAHIQGAALRRKLSLEDASDHDAVFQHGIVVLIITDGRALEN